MKKVLFISFATFLFAQDFRMIITHTTDNLYKIENDNQYYIRLINNPYWSNDVIKESKNELVTLRLQYNTASVCFEETDYDFYEKRYITTSDCYLVSETYERRSCFNCYGGFSGLNYKFEEIGSVLEPTPLNNIINYIKKQF